MSLYSEPFGLQDKEYDHMFFEKDVKEAVRILKQRIKEEAEFYDDWEMVYIIIERVFGRKLYGDRLLNTTNNVKISNSKEKKK